MITKKQFREAMAIIETYCGQIEDQRSPNVSTIGCRVKLSAHGLEMQGKRKKDFRGKVVDYFNPSGYAGQGLVTVKWDQRKKPDGMHESQVEPVNEKL